MGQVYEVVWAGRHQDKMEDARWEALIKSLQGRVL
jgi:hypothetical protein